MKKQILVILATLTGFYIEAGGKNGNRKQHQKPPCIPIEESEDTSSFSAQKAEEQEKPLLLSSPVLPHPGTTAPPVSHAESTAQSEDGRTQQEIIEDDEFIMEEKDQTDASQSFFSNNHENQAPMSKKSSSGSLDLNDEEQYKLAGSQVVSDTPLAQAKNCLYNLLNRLSLQRCFDLMIHYEQQGNAQLKLLSEMEEQHKTTFVNQLIDEAQKASNAEQTIQTATFIKKHKLVSYISTNNENFMNQSLKMIATNSALASLNFKFSEDKDSIQTPRTHLLEELKKNLYSQ